MAVIRLACFDPGGESLAVSLEFLGAGRVTRSAYGARACAGHADWTEIVGCKDRTLDPGPIERYLQLHTSTWDVRPRQLPHSPLGAASRVSLTS